MSLAVVAVYCQPLFDKNSPQIGLDYWHLHARRMQFARDAVFSPESALPGWYPREFLGTPFWANVQNFPFIRSEERRVGKECRSVVGTCTEEVTKKVEK